jgi:hypothetical protein
MFLLKKQSTNKSILNEKPSAAEMTTRVIKNKHTLPQAPSPTITSFLLISDIAYRKGFDEKGFRGSIKK